VTRCVAHLMRLVGAERCVSSPPASLFGDAAIIGGVESVGQPGEQEVVSCGETMPREAIGLGCFGVG